MFYRHIPGIHCVISEPDNLLKLRPARPSPGLAITTGAPSSSPLHNNFAIPRAIRIGKQRHPFSVVGADSIHLAYSCGQPARKLTCHLGKVEGWAEAVR